MFADGREWLNIYSIGQIKIICRGLNLWVAEVVEADVGKPCVLEDLLVKVDHGIWVVHLPGGGGGKEVGAVRVLVMLLDQQVHRFLRDGHSPY